MPYILKPAVEGKRMVVQCNGRMDTVHPPITLHSVALDIVELRAMHFENAMIYKAPCGKPSPFFVLVYACLYLYLLFVANKILPRAIQII